MKINYSGINQALAKEFGDGNVELRKAPKDSPWDFVLWFKDDNTPPAVMDKAQDIVSQFEPSVFYPDLIHHVDE